ncbi:MAG: HAD family hydrolase [Erysipelotrichaceae bacterium]|jgi:Cof subfamily protein (haloacid dehalogenase superfamily)
MIKALVFDVDDTLIKYGKEYVEPSAVEAINLAKKKGIKIIVATGRGYKFLHRDIKNRVKADYYITVNGACINSHDGKTLECFPLSKKTTDRLLEICYQKKYSFGFKFDDSLQVYADYPYFTSCYCNAAIKKETIDDNSQTRDYHLTHMLPLGCFIYSFEKEAMKLAEQFDDLQFISCYLHGCECIRRDVNKGKSLKRLLESLNISLKDCLAFGDGINDKELLQMCGIGVCMGNGQESLKEISDFVTTAIEEDGIYKALKHFRII